MYIAPDALQLGHVDEQLDLPLGRKVLLDFGLEPPQQKGAQQLVELVQNVL